MANKLDAFLELLQSEKVIIKNKSVLNFPDNLSEKNIPASKVKNAIASPVVGDNHSVIALLASLVEALDGADGSDGVFDDYDDIIDTLVKNVTASSVTQNEDNVTYTLTFTKYDNSTVVITITLPKASSTSAGVMSKADYNMLQAHDSDLRSDVAYAIDFATTRSSSSYVITLMLLNSTGSDIGGTATIEVPIAMATTSKAGLMSATDKQAVDNINSSIATEINKIKSGTYTAKKAEKDASGNTITSTYETKSDAAAKVARANLVSILGEASQSLNGLLSATDKARLDTLYALLADNDSNTVVDTIQEVLNIFSNYPEGTTLVNALALKVNIADIVDNLSSSSAVVPLSAKQGKVLKDAIDDIEDGTTVVGKAYCDEDGNNIAETYFSHEDGFAVGMVAVTEYDEDTGEITLEYNDSAVTSIVYDSDTGIVTFTY